MNDKILEIKNLYSGYNKDYILKNINFSMNYGEIVGIIGPNGSGKSTLFNSITKIIKNYNGDIKIDNKNIKNISNKELAKIIALVSQNLDSYNINCYDFVLMGRIPYFKFLQYFESEEDIKIANYYIDLLKINYLMNKNLSEISGGEKQLVYICKALTQTPKLLLLDEPISNLDIAHQIQIMNLIKKLNKELKISILIILHDLNIASEYCDKLILLNKGEIFRTGTPEQVIDYKSIEEVYQTIVIVKENPLSKKPYVILVSSIN